MPLPKGIHQYCKKNLGVASKDGVSVYQLAVDALEINGYPMPTHYSPKKWVNKHKHLFTNASQKPPEPRQRVFRAKPKVRPQEMLFKSTQWALALLQSASLGRCSSCREMCGVLYGQHKISPTERPDMALDKRNIQVLCANCLTKEN